MTESVYGILVELLIFVAVGFVLRKLNILEADLSSRLSDFLPKLVLPFSLIASSQQEFKASSAGGTLISIGLAFLYYLVFFIILRLILPKLFHSYESRPVAYDLCAFANVGFLGFAVVPLIFGENGTLYTISHNFVYQLLFFTIGMDIVEDSAHSVKEMLHPKKFLTNKIILVSILSMALYVLPFRFPQIITNSFRAVGSMMTPLSLIIVGLQIGALDLKALLKEKGVVSLSLIRMLLLPAVYFCILLILPLDAALKGVAFILSAMPSGSLTAVIAERYNRTPVLASSVVALTTILYFLLLPLDITLIRFF